MNQSPLGQKTSYPRQYDASLLFPIPRAPQRVDIGVGDHLPFSGMDIWNAYEISWLNDKGKPVVAMAEFFIPIDSPNLVESKSFKLYLNSFNQSRFSSLQAVAELMANDLSQVAGAQVRLTLVPLGQMNQNAALSNAPGRCLDELDVRIDCYQVNPNLLEIEDQQSVSECWHSHLLNTNCLVTGQPDWATVVIEYLGNKIVPDSLLRYLVSFRQHQEFHEHCVERIFQDIKSQCAPDKLTVYARYLRRGGLDINPYRSDDDAFLMVNQRLLRQ